MQERRNPKRRMTRALAIFLVLLLLGAVGGVAYLMCRVEDIAVEGASQYTREQIIGMSGIQLDDSMFFINDRAICAALQKDPLIEAASIEKKFPQTITIRITERQPVALIQYMDAYFKMDAEGYILEKAGADTALVAATGINVSSLQIGQVIKSSDPQQVNAYIAIMEKLKKSAIFSSISEINCANVENIYIMTDQRIRVRIGNLDSLEKKMVWVESVLPVLAQQGKSGGTLDVTNTQSVSYVPE